MYQLFYRKVVYPLYHRVIGSGALAAIRELDAHDRLTAEQLQDVTSTKLRTLLLHAAEHVPYYRTLIQENGIDVESGQHGIAKIPVLTKDIIRAQQDSLKSLDLSGNRLYPNSTSGSTGSPLHFFTDLRSKTYRKATVIRNRHWLGVNVGDKIVNLWGSPIDQARVAALRGRLHSILTRVKFLSAYSLSDADMQDYAEQIARYRPRLLVGYPSVLSEFARFCERNSIALPALRAIICSAEALFEQQRDIIERIFAAPVFNRYGCREVGDIAHQVPGQQGLVVNSDRIFLEIVDQDGQPCPPGVVGEILVTDLDNFGMPLIRYRIGDSGCWLDRADVSTHLPYPVLQAVEGRSMDVVIAPSGKRVGGTFWTILFRKRPGIDLFQVVQDEVSSLQIRYVQSAAVGVVDTEYFRNKIIETCGEGLNIEFTRVDAIEPDPSGKRRLVLSSVKQASGSGSVDAGEAE